MAVSRDEFFHFSIILQLSPRVTNCDRTRGRRCWFCGGFTSGRTRNRPLTKAWTNSRSIKRNFKTTRFVWRTEPISKTVDRLNMAEESYRRDVQRYLRRFHFDIVTNYAPKCKRRWFLFHETCSTLESIALFMAHSYRKPLNAKIFAFSVESIYWSPVSFSVFRVFYIFSPSFSINNFTRQLVIKVENRLLSRRG